ncbi:STAS domain-containing protein [Aestuariivirga sp.]|jgi:anti-anti-sigma factor|uniref:STAS domain-containing protein n=1 Tax=Aestuariivirga sp. TaxID=2650926 RepID=UPI0037838730
MAAACVIGNQVEDISMTVKTLKLEGRLDTPAVAKVEVGFAAKAGALTKNGDKAIIDLQDVIYISSMGIRLLVSTIKQFRQRGVEFVTVRPSEAAANEILVVANLTDHLNMVEDKEAAHALVNQF